MITNLPCRNPLTQAQYFEYGLLALDVTLLDINANEIQVVVIKLSHQMVAVVLVKVERENVILVAMKNSIGGYDSLSIPKRRAIWKTI